MMKLICTITGVQVEASEQAAERLIASGSFMPEEKPKPAPRKKASTKKED